jgi:endonuclease/exonuclease/phosphatase family metal-dependent hydrolase
MVLVQMLATLLAFVWVMAAPAKKAARFFRLVLVTCNDDWASAGSNMTELLRLAKPDVIFIQEGKRANYAALVYPGSKRRLFPPEDWLVHQDISSEARAGSVVIVRKAAAPILGRAGFTFGVKATGLLPRWVAWVRVRIQGVRFFLFSAHRPPVRVRRFWHPFDIALWARLKLAQAAGRVIMGGSDSNQHGGPSRIPRGLKWAGLRGSIDGFILSKRVRVAHIRELPKGTSDHHPVLATVEIPIPARARR